MQDCPFLSVWTIWSDCNEQCGGGKRSRFRICANGGQESCSGPLLEETSCNNQVGKAIEDFSKCCQNCLFYFSKSAQYLCYIKINNLERPLKL